MGKTEDCGERKREREKGGEKRMSTSTWFLQSALASSQQIWMGPKLVAAAAAPSPHSHPSPSLSLAVEAKSRTSREDRTARHIRIRKKVVLSYPSLYLSIHLFRYHSCLLTVYARVLDWHALCSQNCL